MPRVERRVAVLSTMLSVYVCLCVCLAAPGASATVITSTEAGGPWSQGSTWIGGVVPGAGDDVVIAGPVQAAANASCLRLEVQAGASLTGGFSGWQTLHVGGTVQNQGEILGGPSWFDMTVGGDLQDDGTWKTHKVTFTGSSDRRIAMNAGAVLESDLTLDLAASGDMIVATPLSFVGSVDTGPGRMLLEPSCPMVLQQGRLKGDIRAGGNEIRFESWSYMQQCNLDAGVVAGVAQVSQGVTFTGGLTVMDTLQNLPSGGGSHIQIHGGLVNHGLIRNHTYGLTIDLAGDLTCNGRITCSHVTLDDAAERRLSMGPDGEIACPVILPEFGSGTLIAETPIHFSGGLATGVNGRLILRPGSSVLLTDHGSISSGTIEANGNEIRMEGTGGVSGHLDSGVLGGRMQIATSILCTGGLTVVDTLQNWEWAAAEIRVDGRLVNEGLVRDNTRPVSVIALGDVENRGQWRNTNLTIAGENDQTVAAGPGIGVSQFVLDSRLEAGPFQWLRDGEPIEGATGATLTFQGIGAGDYGTYLCSGGGGVLSRTIVIDAVSTAAAESPGTITANLLDQNRPNPFRPVTEIAFSLGAPSQVRLSVFDVAGREVSVLLDRQMPAGRHVAHWRPGSLPAGVYFYRLGAGNTEMIRKAVRID